MSNVTVALDAGHGGNDPGAVYNGRREKDDALRLTNAIGKILEMNGVNVYYVRTDDEYETPFKKATDANNAGADLFVSIHRNSSERNNQYSGIQSLVYANSGMRRTLAQNINKELSDAGFENLGIVERPNLVVLKRTQMPAVLVEAGFINSDTDNKIFDNNFDEIARAIADGILETIYSGMSKTDAGAYGEDEIDTDTLNSYQENQQTDEQRVPMSDDTTQSRRQNGFYCDCGGENEKLYRVQVGAYRNKENADRMLDALLIEGFPAFMLYDDGYYKVQVGAFEYLTNAIKMEQRLRRFRYNTYIVYN